MNKYWFIYFAGYDGPIYIHHWTMKDIDEYIRKMELTKHDYLVMDGDIVKGKLPDNL